MALESQTSAAPRPASAAPARTPATKLLPPAPVRAAVPRTALLQRLDHALFRRLTAVVAGPGFGKSTLLAAWAKTAPCAWYTVTREDAVLPAFARGLVDALGRAGVELPADLAVAAGHGGPGADERVRAESLAALVSEALEGSMSGELAVVLDDVHVLARRTTSARLLEALIRQAPPELHFVLASRAEPPLALERLRGHGDVLDFDAELLAFTAPEVGAVLAASLDDVPEGLAREIHDLTAGWPAAVRLAAETLASQPVGERAAALDRLRRPEGLLFAYLAEEVFGPKDRAARELLRRAAHFDRFSAGLCEALGVSHAADHLRRLVRAGLFVQPQGGADGWFALHAVAREFALERWPLGGEELQALHRDAAEWLDAHGHAEEAVRSLAASSDCEALAQLVTARGPALLAAGSVDSVLLACDALPEELRSPEIEQLAGQARQIRGDWDGALACYRRAGASADELRPGVAWRMGLIHYLRGELEDALAVYERGVTDGAEPHEEALLHAWSATAHWVRGEGDTARALADRALEVATAVDDDCALAAAHTVQAMLASQEGDRAATHRHSGRALEHAERGRDLLQLIRIRANRGSHLAQEGDYDDALAELDEAIRLAELAGFANFHALALSNRGDTKARLGQLDEAVVDLEEAAAIYGRLESNAVSYPLGQLGDVLRERGDLGAARTAFEQAIAAAEQAGDAQGMGPALAGLARVVAADDATRGDELARRVLAGGSGFAHVPGLLAAGWTALALGERQRAAETATSAVAAASDRRDRAGLAEAIELAVLSDPEPMLAAERLEEAISIWRELRSPVGAARAELALGRLSGDAAAADQAEQRLRALRVRTRPPLAAGLLASLPGDERSVVTVSVLGGFAVAVGGVAATTADWKSRKARELLKRLVARRGHPEPREALMEGLWPAEDPARSSNRLSVALATVRSVLDPERRFPPEWYVVGGNDTVALDLEHLTVDAERFLTQAVAGLAHHREQRHGEALPLLEAAEQGYGGDFLEDEPHADWVATLREEARGAYVAVVRALAEVADERGEHDAAVRYRLRILGRDPYDEAAHLGLVSALAAASRNAEARRAYRAYVARMEEIGAEPAPFPAPAALEPADPPSLRSHGRGH